MVRARPLCSFSGWHTMMEQTRASSPSSTANPTTCTNTTDPNSTDTTCTSSGTTAAATPTKAVYNTISMLSKNSHKISKHHHHGRIASATNPRETQTTPQPSPASSSNTNGNPPPQPQPPVYNINKNDFRDVVQKLTGSPAHHHLNPQVPLPSAVISPPPPPPPNTTTASTRLHKIRPPPLAHLNPRPNPTVATGNTWMRAPMTTPDSPLPPLPTVSAAAESPITAYMRCLNGGGQPQSLMTKPPGSADMPLFPLPTSPLGFDGCVPSPRSPMPSPK